MAWILEEICLCTSFFVIYLILKSGINLLFREGFRCFFSNHHVCCSEYGLSQSKGILLPFSFLLFFFPESILIGFHCRKLHWFFFVEIMQPYQQRVMDISVWIAMVASIR